jgi:EAL domain-containing protein (putative c-di-GMP-specific phosphodiesterase class I)
MARVKQQAAELLGHAGALGADRAGLEASFDRAMQSMWIAYHPIVDVRKQAVFGYEALLRSTEPSLPHPGAVIDAAMRLGRIEPLGRAIRSLAAEPIPADENFALFVNLHVTDLTDPALSDPESPLSKIAHRVVLEITERSSLDEVKDARRRVAALREMGFRIAVDDLGAGYAGLSSFTLLEPEIVKLDMSLVRDIHVTSTKQKVVRSMTTLSKDMGMTVVAEGVETKEERDCLVDLGCDLLQGFLFAKPGRAFPGVNW